jgi:pyocin large subunit-like protein
MTHKDAIGQDIMPDDIVAWSPASRGAGHLFGRVVGVSPKQVQVEYRYSINELLNNPARGYKTSVRPENLIVITKLVP